MNQTMNIKILIRYKTNKDLIIVLNLIFLPHKKIKQDGVARTLLVAYGVNC